MPAREPSFTDEFRLWWEEIGSNTIFNVGTWWSRPVDKSPFGPNRSFFMFCYSKGWIPQEVLTPLLPFTGLFMGSIILLFLTPVPSIYISSAAWLMLLCLAWLAVRVAAYCRLALIDIFFLALPLLILAFAGL